MSPIRRLIWLYMFLWLVEGALRFWVFPSLYGPLALVRDPVVIVIYLLALQNRVFPVNGFVGGTLLLAMISFPLALIFGHGNLTVAVYGLRANFLHLPLIFVMGRVLTSQDLHRLCRWVLILAVPMAVLAVRQFQSPDGSLINRGGMHTHYGSVRPAGTFSFISAMVHFITLVAAVVAWRLMRPPKTWSVAIFAGGLALVVMVMVSGSRTAVVSVAVIGLLAVAAAVGRGRNGAPFVFGLAVLGVVVAFVSSSEFIEQGSDQLGRRFDDAGAGRSVVEVSLERLQESTWNPLSRAFQRDLMGEGLGFGTNVGGAELTGSRHAFLVGESEWDRMLGELGPVLGLAFILVRLGLVLQMGKLAWRVGILGGQPLLVLLFGVAWLPVLAGQWGVPALQGFASISAGLFYASARQAVSRRGQVKKPAPVRAAELPLPAGEVAEG